MRAAVLLLVLALALLAAAMYPLRGGWPEPQSPAGDVSVATAPAFPKTRAQVESEAWTLASQIRAGAGRMTSSATDGTGGSATQRTTTDNTAALLNQGSFVGTQVPWGTNKVVLDQISYDDFQNSSVNQWWSEVRGKPLYVGLNGAFQTPIISAGYWGTAGTVFSGGCTNPAGPACGDWLYLNVPLDTTSNASIQVKSSTVSPTATTDVWIASEAPAYGSNDYASLNSHYMARFQTTTNTINQAMKLAYNDTGGATHWWDGGTWGTSDLSFGNVPASAAVEPHFQRDSGGSQWVLTVFRKDTGAMVTKATVPFASMFSGSTLPYFVGGQPQNPSWDVVSNSWFVLDNFAVSPTLVPSSATFTSRPVGFGEWTALLVKFSYITTNTPSFQIRYANNSDMTNAVAFFSVTNNTDVSASNYRAAYFQVRVTLTTTAQVLWSYTWTYNSINYGSPPGKDTSAVMIGNTTWNNQNYIIHTLTRVYMNYTGVLNVFINNSIVDGTNYTNLNNVFQFQTTATSGTFTIRISNSTIKNFGNLTKGSWSAPTNVKMYIYLDNVTASNFNNAGPDCLLDGGSACVWAPNWFKYTSMQRSNVSKYNIALGGGWSACDNCFYFDHNYVTTYIWSSGTAPGATGNAIVSSFYPGTKVRNNWVEGGFAGFTYLGNISGVGAARTVEGVNVSNNYFNKVAHTAIGFYGTNFPTAFYWSVNIGAPYYASIYKNVVANGTYIQIQTGGVGNLTYKLNYLTRGVSNGAFAEGLGMNWNTANTTFDHNYFWGMNGTSCSICVTGFSSYANTFTNNILYDTTGWPILLDFAGGRVDPITQVHDYSYRGSVSFSNNFYDGAYGSGYIYNDMGYITFHNDTFGPNHVSSKNGFPWAYSKADLAPSLGIGIIDTQMYDPQGMDETWDSGWGALKVFDGPDAYIRVYSTTGFKSGGDGTTIHATSGDQSLLVQAPAGTQLQQPLVTSRAIPSTNAIPDNRDTLYTSYSVMLDAPSGKRVYSLQDLSTSPVTSVSLSGATDHPTFVAVPGADYYVVWEAYGPVAPAPVFGGPIVTSGVDWWRLPAVVFIIVLVVVLVSAYVRWGQ